MCKNITPGEFSLKVLKLGLLPPLEDIIVAGITKEKADVDKQKDLMAKAKAAGAVLVTKSKAWIHD